ncbi:WD40 repeat domain-containing protein [Nocardia sp. NPDC058058]|uniref:WD40 repeat domain-containing protein n=1 Tax=Nocardia sp. NPDC058058 TaxID=3346317 RepID=UPI0036D9B315
MVTGDTDSETQVRSPRTHFAQRFAELYEAAGNPTLRRVATAAEHRMRAAQGTRPGGASAQRISDWKAGRNVPARFESLLPVVLTLIDLARKSGTPLPRELAEPREWQRLWQSATTWNPEADTESACPYPGLVSYGSADHDLFFGRTRATTELTDLIRTATGPITLIGASGAGKSSLLAAGIIPALTDWETTTLTPGAHPLTALAEALEGSASASSQSDSAHTDSVPAQLESALAPRADSPRRLLIIDQFEELFTTCATEREREDFLTTLHTAATRTDDPVSVVLALRADFYAHCLNYQILQDALENRSYLLGPMRPDELAQAISAPARSVGLDLEPGLEELVITELCGAGDHHGRQTYDPGALPLLSHVMAATWQHREGRRLTITGYRNSGGVVGSVTETAEHAWNELDTPQRTAAREVLLGLVTVSQDSRDTRRRAQRPDLLRRAESPEDATAAMELLSRTRLITLDADAVTLTHEIVLTAWPRLRTWIDEDRVGYLVRQRLETDAAEWAAQDRDSSLLYRGTRLQNALQHVAPPPVGPLAQQFLDAASNTARKSKLLGRTTKAGLVFLGVCLLIVGMVSYNNGRRADQQRADKNFAAVMATADRLVAADPSVAAQMYLIAHRMRPEDEDVRTRLLQTQNLPLMTRIPAHDKEITEIRYRPDGGVLASIASDDTLRLWDAATPHQLRQLGAPISDVKHVAFSPDGTLMITSSYLVDPQVWDIHTPDTPRLLTTLSRNGQSRPIETIFLGDGRTVAAYSAADLTLWNISDPATPIPGTSTPLPRKSDPAAPISIGLESLAYNAAGHILATTDFAESSGTVRLWDVSNPVAATPLSEFQAASGGTRHIVISPDGNTLAAGGYEAVPGTTRMTSILRLWDITDHAHPRLASILADPDGGTVLGLAYSPGGQTLAVAGGNGGALWNVLDPVTPTRHPNRLSTSASTCRYDGSSGECDGAFEVLTYTPDGRTLTTGNLSGQIQLWSLPSADLNGYSGTVSESVFDASGDRMVTISSDGRVLVWDLRNILAPQRIGNYTLPRGYYSPHLSPDGRTLLATTHSPATALLLDLSDPAHIAPPITWPLISMNELVTVTLSPDWRRAATVGAHHAQLWDLSDRTHPVPLGVRITPAGEIPVFQTGTFSPDGRTLLITELSGGTSGDLVVVRWDISDPGRPRQLNELFHAPARETYRVAFTPDFHTLMAVGMKSMRSWDIEDPEKPVPLSDPMISPPGSILSIDFTADGRTMVINAIDGSVQLWDFSDRAHPRRIGGSLVYSDETMDARFHPSDRFLIATGGGGAVRLWDLDPEHAATRVCTATGAMWTPQLWQYYLPQLSYKPPCA